MCHASLCCLVLCKPFNDLSFISATGCFPDCGCKGTSFFAFRQTFNQLFFKKMRIFENPDTRRGGYIIIYMGGGNRTVPPRRGTSPEGAEGVSRPQGRNDSFVCHAAAIMAVLFAMWVVTTLLCAMRDDSVGGKPLRPFGPPPLQGGGVFPCTKSFRARNNLFQGLEHQIPKPETLRQLTLLS